MNAKFTTQIMIFIIMGVTIFGCNDSENEPPYSSSVDFLKLNDSIRQTDDSLVVKIQLNKKAGIDGHINVRLSGGASPNVDYSTKPEAVNGIIALALLREMQTVDFKIFRSGQLQTDKTIGLTLESPTRGFVLGNKSSASVKLMKKLEVVDSINFTDEFIHISEFETTGYDINLVLSGSITKTEHVFIDIINPEGIKYGTNYSTSIGAVQNELNLEVTPGMKTVSFKVLPVNDNVVSGNYELLFKVSSTTGQLRKGIRDSLKVRVEEDDNNITEIHSIADLKKMFSVHEGEFWLGDDYYIQGIITSGTNVIDDKTAYIQDGSDGIMLRFTIKNMLKLGDKVRINLKGASGNLVNDQKAIFNISDMAGVKLSENQIVTPEVITLEQLATGSYEGRRVRINDVQFSQANGTIVFEGNREITSGTSNAIVTTYGTAQFKNTVIPEGKLSVTGVVGDWGRILPQLYNTDIVKNAL